MTKIPNFEHSRWRTAAILKIVLSLYLSGKSSDFNEIWYADADYDSKVGCLTKYQNFSIQNGGRPPYWKSSFGYISTNDYQINAKFCRMKHNHVLTQVVWPKYRILKIQDGGRPPFWKWFYRYNNSAGNHPISAKFSVQPQVTLSRTVTWQNATILQTQHGRRTP